jgi:hypothetical protein
MIIPCDTVHRLLKTDYAILVQIPKKFHVDLLPSVSDVIRTKVNDNKFVVFNCHTAPHTATVTAFNIPILNSTTEVIQRIRPGPRLV